MAVRFEDIIDALEEMKANIEKLRVEVALLGRNPTLTTTKADTLIADNQARKTAQATQLSQLAAAGLIRGAGAGARVGAGRGGG